MYSSKTLFTVRILLVNDHYSFGGAENYVRGLEEQLEKDHEVKILTLDGSEDADYTIDESSNPLLQMKNRYFSNRKIKKKVSGLVEDFDPDVVHLNKNIVAPVAVLKGLKCQKVIKTVHDFGYVSLEDKYAYEMNPWERRVRKFMDLGTQRYLKTLRKTVIDSYTAPSQALTRELENNDLKPVKYLPNFVTDRNHSFGGEHFLFVGRLENGKAPDILLEVYEESSNLPPLEIVGKGKMKEELEERSEDLERVAVHGYVSEEKLEELYLNAKAVVIPSRWRENNPLVALEAKAYGSGLIVSNRGGLPELVQKGKTGFIFQSENKDELRQTLTREADWEKMARNSWGDYEQNYRPEVHLQKLLEIYTNT